MMRTFKRVAAIALALTGIAWGQARAGLSPGTASSYANAHMIKAITIDWADDLDFGNVQAGVTSGTVVIPPNGARSGSGGVTLGAPSSEGPAIFNVAGEPGASYSITLPSSLTLDHNTDHMTVDTFVSTPSTTGTLDGDGKNVLKVGATLHVAANQPPGTYTKQFTVTVTYN